MEPFAHAACFAHKVASGLYSRSNTNVKANPYNAGAAPSCSMFKKERLSVGPVELSGTRQWPMPAGASAKTAPLTGQRMPAY